MAKGYHQQEAEAYVLLIRSEAIFTLECNGCQARSFMLAKEVSAKRRRRRHFNSRLSFICKKCGGRSIKWAIYRPTAIP